MADLEIAQLPIGNLLPTQAYLDFQAHQRKPERWRLMPVAAVLYKGELDDPDATYLLANGHHRAYLELRMGGLTVPGRVLSQDAQIRDSTDLALKTFETMYALKAEYRAIWRPSLEALG